MDTDVYCENPEENTISFTRHPIFMEKRQLWGYQVGCIDQCGDATHRCQGDISDLVGTSSYLGLEKILTRGKRLMMRHSQKNIVNSLPATLPAAFGVIKVDEQDLLNEIMVPELTRLKEDGYLIAVGRYSGDVRLNEAYTLADILCIETEGKDPKGLEVLVASAKAYSAEVMGEQIPDTASFELCKELGFTLFQGQFFKTPETVSVRKITSNEAARFQLMKLIEDPEPDFEKLAQTIQGDVSISLRLLTYLNSAGFGLTQKISSIQQAIAMLGWQNLKKWLRVVLLSDVSQHQNAQELVVLSSQRGRFLETVVREHDFWGFSPDAFFLLGVFSLLDAILGMPMERVVEHLPLDDKIRAALCRDPNNEYFPLLRLAEYLEDGVWPKAEHLIQNLSMNDAKVKSAFHDAVTWANTLVSLQP